MTKTSRPNPTTCMRTMTVPYAETSTQSSRRQRLQWGLASVRLAMVGTGESVGSCVGSCVGATAHPPRDGTQDVGEATGLAPHAQGGPPLRDSAGFTPDFARKH